MGGGGRYDDLVKALGGDDVPALGFAYTLERVIEALESEGAVPDWPATLVHSKDKNASSRGS
jgi:histidyl-tRNA synthetase